MLKWEEKGERIKMEMTAVKCPACEGTNLSKNGKGANGIQRYRGNHKECPGKSFMREYACNGWKHGIDRDSITMTANACGIRASARVLEIAKQKGCDTLENGKSGKQRQQQLPKKRQGGRYKS